MENVKFGLSLLKFHRSVFSLMSFLAPVMMQIVIFGPIFGQSIDRSRNVSTANAPKLFVGAAHSGDIKSIDFNSDGTLLASVANEFYGEGDNRILIWQLKTGKVIRVLNDTSKRIGNVRFLNNNLLLTYSSDNCLIWDVQSGKLIKKFRGSPHLTGNGAYLTMVSENGATTFQTSDWTQIKSLTHTSIPGKIYVSPNGESLISIEDHRPINAKTGEPERSYNHSNITLKVWSGESRTLVKSFFIGDRPLSSLNTGVLFLPDNRHVLIGLGLNGAQITKIDLTGKESPVYINKSSGEGYISAAALNNAGNLLCIAHSTILGVKENGKVQLWNVDKQGPPIMLTTCDNEIYAATFSYDGRWLAIAGGDKAIHLWDISQRKELQTLSGQSNSVQSLSFSQDGRYFANTSRDGIIKIWNSQSGTLFNTIKAEGHVMGHATIRSVVFSPDGKSIAYGGFGALDIVELGDVNHSKSINVPFPSNGEVLNVLNINDVFFSPDGTIVGETEPVRGLVRLFSIKSGQEINHFPSRDNRPIISKDGKTIVTTYESSALLYDIISGLLIRTLKNFRPVDFNEIGTGIIGLKKDNGQTSIVTIDLRNGKEENSKCNSNQILKLCVVSPDKKQFAASDESNAIWVWDLATGKQLSHIARQRDSVVTLIFANNSEELITTNQEGTSRIWRVRDSEIVGNIYSVGYGDWLVVNNLGYFDGSQTAWGKTFWRFSDSLYDFVPVEQFFNEFFYPGLLSNLLNGQSIYTPLNITNKDRRQPVISINIEEKYKKQISDIRLVNAEIIVTESAPDINHQKSSGMQDLRLFRNGSLVKIWHGELSGKDGKAIINTSLPLVNGTNYFQLYCYNRDNVKSLTETITIECRSKLYRKPRLFILSVGINHYRYAYSDSLQFAVSDAVAFSSEISKQQLSAHSGIIVEKINLLDSAATKAAIIEQLKLIAAKVQPEDMVMLFFSLHGFSDDRNFYFITHDTQMKGQPITNQQENYEGILSNSISTPELEKIFDQADAKKVILIIDACQSGKLLEASDTRQGPLNIKGLTQLAYEKGMYILAATRSSDDALEEGKFGHGRLTYALINEGLIGGLADIEPKNGKTTIREWLDFATARVPGYTTSATQANLINIFPDSKTALSYKDKIKKSFVQQPVLLYRRDVPDDTLVIAVHNNLLDAGQGSKVDTTLEFVRDTVLKKNMILLDTAKKLYYKGKYDLAHENLQQAIRLQPENISTLTFIAHTFYSKGDFKTAEPYYQKVVSYRPDFGTGYFNLANCEDQLGEYQKEIVTLKKGVDVEPANSDINHQLGVTLLFQSEYKNAIEFLQNAVMNCDDQKDLALYSYDLGMAYFCDGKFSDAALALKQSYMQSSDHDSQLPLLYLINRLSGDAEIASNYLKETTKYTDTANWRTPIYKYFRREISAATLIKQANTPDNLMRAHAFIAIDLYLNGNKSQAKKQWQWVLEHKNTRLSAYHLAQKIIEGHGGS